MNIARSLFFVLSFSIIGTHYAYALKTQTAFEVHACDAEIIRSAASLRSCLEKVVDTLDLDTYEQPVVKYYGTAYEGFVVYQLLDKGVITMLINNAQNSAHIYIVSSKPFDPVTASACAHAYLKCV
jgi:hypothetical protein